MSTNVSIRMIITSVLVSFVFIMIANILKLGQVERFAGAFIIGAVIGTVEAYFATRK